MSCGEVRFQAYCLPKFRHALVTVIRKLVNHSDAVVAERVPRIDFQNCSKLRQGLIKMLELHQGRCQLIACAEIDSPESQCRLKLSNGTPMVSCLAQQQAKLKMSAGILRLETDQISKVLSCSTPVSCGPLRHR